MPRPTSFLPFSSTLTSHHHRSSPSALPRPPGPRLQPASQSPPAPAPAPTPPHAPQQEPKGSTPKISSQPVSRKLTPLAPLLSSEVCCECRHSACRVRTRARCRCTAQARPCAPAPALQALVHVQRSAVRAYSDPHWEDAARKGARNEGGPPDHRASRKESPRETIKASPAS